MEQGNNKAMVRVREEEGGRGKITENSENHKLRYFLIIVNYCYTTNSMCTSNFQTLTVYATK